jgi:hypothetical protein
MPLKKSSMQIHSEVEEMIITGFKGLCETCVNAETCVYSRLAAKAVIQCELFEENHEEIRTENPCGLCRNCENAPTCKLPGRKHGVWHCEEFY